MPAQASPTREGAGGDAASQGRLAWLDALRGIAVLFVVFDHLNLYVLPTLHQVIAPWFDAGKYGVMVFFLVSGYIVPASLERKGSVRRFWVSRLFRLYPMWAVTILAALVLTGLGLSGLNGAAQHPAASTLAHMLMLQDVLGVDDAVSVLWTLSYEMVFYLLITCLFVVRAHRRNAGFAIGFAAAAVALGGMLPTQALSTGHSGIRVVAVSAAALVVAGLAAAVSGHRRFQVAGGVLLGATALILVSFNSRTWVWESFAILAWMFTGTTIYRAEHGDVSKKTAAVTAGLVLVLTVIGGVLHSYPWGVTPGIATYLLAAATFAAGMVLWRRRAPRFLAWTGLVSYSAYLLHPLLLPVFFTMPWISTITRAGPYGGALAVAFIACLLACCWASYRFVEAPAQRAGRWLGRWLDARLGSDALPRNDGSRSAA